MTNDLHIEFEWRNAEPTEAHAYLLPGLLKHLERNFGERKVSILDIGCGNGFVASELSRRGHRVVGVDSSKDGLDIAKAAFKDVEFHKMSIYSDDFPGFLGRKFDCVLSLEVIEHLMFPNRLLKKGRDALADEGVFIVSTPYHGYLKNIAISFANGWDKHWGVQNAGGHVKFFSIRTMTAMALSAGLRPTSFSGVGRIPGLWKSMFMVAQR